MVVVAISGVIAIVVVAVHIAQERIYAGEDAYITMYRNAATVIDRITNTLRIAGYNPKDSSQFDPGIRYGGADSIVIVVDYDTNGVLGSDETIVYTSGNFTSLRIDSLRFEYLNRSHNPFSPDTLLNSLRFINSVRVTVVMIRDEKLPGPHRYELTREVKLRN